MMGMDTGSPTAEQTVQNQQPPCTKPVGHPSACETPQIQAGLSEPAKHVRYQKHHIIFTVPLP